MVMCIFFFVFFFSSRRRHTRLVSDWSSDVCSSDLDEENSLGARCLGTPIFDATGNVTAALGASGTLTQMDEDNMPRIIDALKETARRISRQLQRSGTAGAA